MSSINHLYGKGRQTNELGDWMTQSEPIKQTIGNKYFEYDQLELYHGKLNFSKIQRLYFDKPETEMDSVKRGVYFKNIPRAISDSSIVHKLESIGYKKSIVDPSKFKEIDKIFVEKSTTTSDVTFCINVYRDILVFKNKGKIIGMAKICFECSSNKISGTSANTEKFGQDGDYVKLREILMKR